MQVVKKQNITNKLFVGLILCLSTCISAQYSPTFLGDSTKLEILKTYNISLQPSSIKDVSVNRNKMAIFCKWELDIEDFTKLPVKFRLGSQEIVDRMENKGPTTIKN